MASSNFSDVFPFENSPTTDTTQLIDLNQITTMNSPFIHIELKTTELQPGDLTTSASQPIRHTSHECDPGLATVEPTLKAAPREHFLSTTIGLEPIRTDQSTAATPSTDGPNMIPVADNFVQAAPLTSSKRQRQVSRSLSGYDYVQPPLSLHQASYRSHPLLQPTRTLVYVDDIIITGTDSARISKLKLLDLGKLKYFLGIEVARSPVGIALSQRKYVLDILAESGLTRCKPASFPIEQQYKLSLDSGELCKDPRQCRRLIGRLLYLTITHPDICYAVHILSQFMHAPRQPHLDVAHKVLSYLKGNPGQGIMLSSDGSLSLRAHCDADWAGCSIKQIRHRLYCLSWVFSYFMALEETNGCFHSSAEAKYRAMATTTTSEIIWLLRLLWNLRVTEKFLIPLFSDNQAAIHIAANPVFHERTKHIEIDYHFNQQHILPQTLVTPPISSQN
ncbi:hypothetical protein RJ639_014189 [Escallonia herrerae]|uniref:Reverse transcriptase Ty1/copia-type domain-containing protein n=1 Tax=Escallonia herrerae TaxID=1293975 RepID=A0AA89ACL0_9ASTE|nr:hypothetical protein RJ639_023325 [Escallonia herrerae]KAK3008862.1 hypothetical protein RJ639_014189 [Escallonia herrerae]